MALVLYTGYILGSIYLVSLAKSLKSKWVSIEARSSAQYFFAIVLKVRSRGFSAGLPWELLYADDLVIMAESLDELSVKLERCKAELSVKGLKVNTKKTKTMISKPGVGPVWEIPMQCLLERCWE